MKPEVLIAGAGPTGLVLALWLKRLNVNVRIIDKTAEPGTTSRALAVQARTLEFYHQIGLEEAVIAGGVKIANLNLWAHGHRAARVSLQRTGEGLTPYAFALVFPQDAHERLLIERLSALGVQVERQTELLHFSQDDSGVTATLRLPDGSEEVCEAAYLAGCDGATSTRREPFSQQTRLSPWRCRAHPQSCRWTGDEHRNRRCRQPCVEARRGTEGWRRRQLA